MSKPKTQAFTKWFPSTHAVDQVNIRFGVEKDAVHDWIRNEMRSAKYVMTKPGTGRMIYESADARIVVSDNGETTISVTPIMTSLPVHDKVRALVQRQLNVAEAAHKRQLRKLNIELARQDVLMAQLRLNKLNAKSPVAQAQIDRKLAVVQTTVDRINLRVRHADETLDTERRAAKMYGIHTAS